MMVAPDPLVPIEEAAEAMGSRFGFAVGTGVFL
jgi:hypothetical protein